jgi:hypothetical protein
MRIFEVGETFIVPEYGTIVQSKLYGKGLLNGCQLLYLQRNGNTKDIRRVFCWNDGAIFRITKVSD